MYFTSIGCIHFLCHSSKINQNILPYIEMAKNCDLPWVLSHTHIYKYMYLENFEQNYIILIIFKETKITNQN